MYRVERYGTGRFWAVYKGGELVCVTVYKKGAKAVKDRLERLGGEFVSSANHRENDIDVEETCNFLHSCGARAPSRR